MINSFLLSDHAYSTIFRARVVDLSDPLIINNAHSIVGGITRYQVDISNMFGRQTRYHSSVRMLRVSVRAVACGAFLCKDVRPMTSGVDYQLHISFVRSLKGRSRTQFCICQESPPIVH